MKMKIGIQLEEEVYQNLEIAAAREKRAIGEVIQDAVTAYLQDKGSLAAESPAWPACLSRLP